MSVHVPYSITVALSYILIYFILFRTSKLGNENFSIKNINALKAHAENLIYSPPKKIVHLVRIPFERPCLALSLHPRAFRLPCSKSKLQIEVGHSRKPGSPGEFNIFACSSLFYTDHLSVMLLQYMWLVGTCCRISLKWLPNQIRESSRKYLDA